MSKVVHFSKRSFVRRQNSRMLSCTRSFAAASSNSLAIRAFRLRNGWILRVERAVEGKVEGFREPASRIEASHRVRSATLRIQRKLWAKLP
jgi:hypothetical protein